jgi:hypothetical protein
MIISRPTFQINSDVAIKAHQAIKGPENHYGGASSILFYSITMDLATPVSMFSNEY